MDNDNEIYEFCIDENLLKAHSNEKKIFIVKKNGICLNQQLILIIIIQII